jgi:hypothetical protein
MDFIRVGFKVFMFVRIYQSTVIFVHINLTNRSFINHMFWNNTFYWVTNCDGDIGPKGKYPQAYLL